MQDIIDDQSTLAASNVNGNDSGHPLQIESDTVVEIRHLLASSYDKFMQLHTDILAGFKDKKSDTSLPTKFNNLVSKYNNLFKILSSDSIFKGQLGNITPYQLPKDLTLSPIDSYKDDVIITDGNSVPSTSSSLTQHNKSVRFKQNLIENSPTRPFKPYKDDIEVAEDDNNHNQSISPINTYKDSLFETINQDNSSDIDNPTIDLSNKQIFIHNQQQFDHQDNRLDQLHTSIKQQREISMHINRETTDQFVLLNDLENGIESSNNRLIRSNNKLTQYREALKKRGDWMCIIILTFVLLFLLIVIK